MLTTRVSDLQRATPESQGIASSAVLQFVEAIENQIHELHSFMLLRHGKVVAEGWWSPYQRENQHMLFSLSKSFTATAVGLAIAEGHFSLDDSVLSFFPAEAPAQVNEHLAAMRVRHLLSMSTGHAEDTMPALIRQSDGNWIRGFFEVPVLHQPGTHFLYNTGATYMLSAIVQQTTGQKLNDYLAARLYEPLGIKHAVWEESPQHINTGGFGLNITTEDIARFGQLYLQKGAWGDHQLIPAAWVEEASAFQVANGDGQSGDWSQGYGYQFWRCQHNAYRGDGAFGQYCVVMPDQDAVLAITAGLGDMQQPLNLVWEILLPAMQTEALPAADTAHAALTKKLAGLNIAPVQGASSSSLAAKISGQTYAVAANALHVERITFNFTASDCTLTLKTARAEEHIRCGYGVWAAGQSILFNEPWVAEPAPLVASAAWTSATTLTVVIRLHKTPFVFTFGYEFAEDQLTINASINVSFEPVKTWTLMAHRV